MKFNEYGYERCDIDSVKNEIQKHMNVLNSANTYDQFKLVFDQINDIMSHVESMAALCNARYTINTFDEFYEKENDFWDETMPLFQEINFNVYKAVLSSVFLNQLKIDIPKTYFLIAENSLKSFDSSIVGDLQNENKLTSAYQKLVSSASIMFDHEVYNLSSLASKTQSADRDTRKRAFTAYWGWMEEHESEFDDIFDRLICIRDKRAKTLGFKNYIELGYILMNRFDYNQSDVSNYRIQVLNDVVGVAEKLYYKQQQRLGLDVLHCYDEKFEFASGNPRPKYDTDELVKRANTMYHELSKETGDFFDFMVDHELMDLESKKGKAGGGYCTFFADYKSPFIFSNFNGTSGDVDVLTHEAGHAFQVYSSMNIKPNECIWPTYESCEIHSMSMEFFAWPWMESFFEEDTQKYFFLHLSSAIKFIPYGILIDHFQHIVYENVELGIEGRKKAFRKLEKQYLPHKNYNECLFLDKGTWWFKQAHIFESPFYYIDYTLAQVCALQFWLRNHEKDETAFKDYYEICKVGGTLTFKEMVSLANLKSPFKDNCLKDVMKVIDNYLNTIDDSKL